MRTTIKTILLAAGMTAALGAASAASADPFAPQLNDAVYGAGQAPQLEQVQFFWGGRNYCWYPGGWHGPGYYWCGYAWRRGFGWGGPYGWNGWRGGGRGYYHGGGYGGHGYGGHGFGGHGGGGHGYGGHGGGHGGHHH
jgi:hypothetical protein